MKHIAVLSNDAGGAEMLASLIKHELFNYEWTIFTSEDSPAHKVFQKTGFRDIIFPCGEKGVEYFVSRKRPDYFIFSTSWSNKECLATVLMKKLEIPVVALLDHWIDYKERFGFPLPGWELNLPDFVAVGDSVAYKVAEKAFFRNVLPINNYYFWDLIEEYKQTSFAPSGELLYISQTVSNIESTKNNFNYLGKYEERVLKLILDNFDLISEHFGIDRINIRLHPSQGSKTFKDYGKAYPHIDIRLQEAGELGLIDSIGESRIVMGINSMGLFIAYLVGKPALSFALDDSKPTLPLPKSFFIHSIDELLRIKYDDIEKKKYNFELYSQYPLNKFLQIIDERYNHENCCNY